MEFLPEEVALAAAPDMPSILQDAEIAFGNGFAESGGSDQGAIFDFSFKRNEVEKGLELGSRGAPICPGVFAVCGKWLQKIEPGSQTEDDALLFAEPENLD
jgi:hypothetical protein